MQSAARLEIEKIKEQCSPFLNGYGEYVTNLKFFFDNVKVIGFVLEAS